MARHLVLIRAIGGSTHAAMPLAELVRRCEAAGLGWVRSVLATGNLLIDCDLASAAVRDRVSGLVAEFGLANEVFVPDLETVRTILAADPFPEAAADHPSALIGVFGHGALALADGLRDHPGPERLAIVHGALVVDYGDRISTSKLPPARIERLLRQPLTFRNWNTLERLAAAK